MTQNHSISKTLERFRSFRYILVLEGVAVGALSGFVIVLFRLVLEHADTLLQGALQYGKKTPGSFRCGFAFWRWFLTWFTGSLNGSR